ncbi:hypothetical protein VOLCADRAFT_91174 [Volvox carteri f. nagariensis]|uniref:Uncharacterized protein n=1 Tax=Volvox carteri f. nagariensis TaxID=3068 RepID=D8TWD5_VOLCA|nr:uncharacterized protein VOLCADRAFT_91174 [Volvox carteri f. nagariensis]EFJ48136.1 hypothetical protein VOLCADRAFT_91174 [Volvox carteri f. nagariensis]|eukprot:XP_002950821.1 hypothetical protein VOLCADRAFT_91174 [Volvox carteri f. nagariensis]
MWAQKPGGQGRNAARRADAQGWLVSCIPPPGPTAQDATASVPHREVRYCSALAAGSRPQQCCDTISADFHKLELEAGPQSFPLPPPPSSQPRDETSDYQSVGVPLPPSAEGLITPGVPLAPSEPDGFSVNKLFLVLP